MSDTPFSVDQAVEALVSTPVLNRDDEAPVENNDVAEEISEDDLPDNLQFDDSEAAEEPSDTDGEDDGSEETDEEDDESQPDEVTELPEFWEAEAKDKFKTLPKEARELILAEDRKARSAVSKQIEQASLAKKQATEVVKTIETKASQMEQLLEQATPVFASKWANIDWPQYYATNPQEAAAAQQQYQREATALQQIMTVKQEADTASLREFHRAEAETLASLAEKDPVVKRLTDPKGGEALKTEVAKYLVANGVDPERLNYVSAAELALATKAKLYDDLVARQGKKMTTSTPAQKNTGTQVKARSSNAPSQPQSQNRVESQKRRLGQTGSVDDAVNLLLMQKQTAKKRK